MKSTDRRFTIAFYNLENLFDTQDDPFTNDDDFTPWSLKRWTKKRLKRKLNKLSTSISRIGEGFSSNPPAIVGISEVENRALLDRLVSRPALAEFDYRIIHSNSPDSRGMDTALLYRDSVFEPLRVERIPVQYPDEDGIIEHSRDILYVEGLLYGLKVCVYVNHWPSRREGVQVTEQRRESAARALLTHWETLGQSGNTELLGGEDGMAESTPLVLIMGDLNDRPKDNAPRMLTATGFFQNPFDAIAGKGLGSVSHRGAWYLFDQILLSREFFGKQERSFTFVRARIFNAKFLGQYRGKFKGYPFRTYAGIRYKGGYSDHFPVFVVLERSEGLQDVPLDE